MAYTTGPITSQGYGQQLAATTSGIQSMGTAVGHTNRAMMNFSSEGVRGAITLENFGNQAAIATKKVLIWQAAIFGVYGVFKKLAETVEVWKDLELSLARISITTGKVGDELYTYFKQVADVAIEFGMPIERTLRGMDLALRATASLTNETKRLATATVMLRDSSILANITGMDYSQSMDILVGSLRQTGLELDQGMMLLDKWVAVSQNAATSVNDLAQGFAIMSGAAASAGLNVDQVNGLVAALSEAVTLGPVEVGNAIRALMSTLYNQESIKTLSRFGVAVRDSAGEVRNYWDIMSQLSAMKQQDVLDESAWLEIAKAAGAGQRRYAQFIALLNNFDQAIATSTISANANGQAIDANAKIVNTLANTWDKFTAAQNKALMTIGKESGAIGSLTNMMQGLATVFDKISGINGPLLTLAKTLTILAAAFVGLKIAKAAGGWLGGLAGVARKLPMMDASIAGFAGVPAASLRGSGAQISAAKLGVSDAANRAAFAKQQQQRTSANLARVRSDQLLTTNTNRMASLTRREIVLKNGLLKATANQQMAAVNLTAAQNRLALVTTASVGTTRMQAMRQGFGRFLPVRDTARPAFAGRAATPALQTLVLDPKDPRGYREAMTRRVSAVPPAPATGGAWYSPRGWDWSGPKQAWAGVGRGAASWGTSGAGAGGGMMGGMMLGMVGQGLGMGGWQSAGMGLGGGVGLALGGPIGMAAGGAVGGFIADTIVKSMISSEDKMKGMFKNIFDDVSTDFATKVQEIIQEVYHPTDVDEGSVFTVEEQIKELRKEAKKEYPKIGSGRQAKYAEYFAPREIQHSAELLKQNYEAKKAWKEGLGALPELERARELGLISQEELNEATKHGFVEWQNISDEVQWTVAAMRGLKALTDEGGIVPDRYKEDAETYRLAVEWAEEYAETQKAVTVAGNAYAVIQAEVSSILERNVEYTERQIVGTEKMFQILSSVANLDFRAPFGLMTGKLGESMQAGQIGLSTTYPGVIASEVGGITTGGKSLLAIERELMQELLEGRSTMSAEDFEMLKDVYGGLALSYATHLEEVSRLGEEYTALGEAIPLEQFLQVKKYAPELLEELQSVTGTITTFNTSWNSFITGQQAKDAKGFLPDVFGEITQENLGDVLEHLNKKLELTNDAETLASLNEIIKTVSTLSDDLVKLENVNLIAQGAVKRVTSFINWGDIQSKPLDIINKIQQGLTDSSSKWGQRYQSLLGIAQLFGKTEKGVFSFYDPSLDKNAIYSEEANTFALNALTGEIEKNTQAMVEVEYNVPTGYHVGKRAWWNETQAALIPNMTNQMLAGVPMSQPLQAQPTTPMLGTEPGAPLIVDTSSTDNILTQSNGTLISIEGQMDNLNVKMGQLLTNMKAMLVGDPDNFNLTSRAGQKSRGKSLTNSR